MADHKRDDAEIVDFVQSLNPHRRAPRRASVRRTDPRRTPPPAPRRWTIPLITVVAALFATGGGIALAATPDTDEPPEVDCTLQVPADPLSAQGLATPYRLLAPCKEADDGMSAFVQATIVDPATGAISVYNPLVTDQDTAPAAAPVVPALPAAAVVGIWFGFNGDNLTLRDSHGSLRAGACVNGLDDSIFGQYAYCNAPAFFTAANAAITAGTLTVPELGTAKDGLACPSTRDFGIVDMDQSDNVTTTYLFMPDGSTAQNTADNQGKLAAKGAKVEVNASDNGLLDSFVSPTLGCTPYMAADLADPGRSVPALALNELQAAAHQAAPVALVPTSDPMALVDGKTSVAKTNLYRAGVNMGPIDPKVETPKAYCQNLVDVGIGRTALDRARTVKVDSPDPGAANSLFTFLAQRLGESFTELDCGKLLGTANPVTVVTDADGVVTDARFAAPPTSPPSRSVPPSRSASPAPSATRSRPAGSASPSAAGPSPSGTPGHTPTAPATTAVPATPTHAPTAPATMNHAATTAPAGRTSAATTPARTAAAPPPARGGTGTGGGGTGTAPGGNGPAVVPAGNPAGAQVSAPPAAATPSGNPALDAPVPVASLTLGPMKEHAGTGGGSAGTASGAGSMPPARLAGTVLLSGGGILIVGILVRGLINMRRRRYRFATEL